MFPKLPKIKKYVYLDNAAATKVDSGFVNNFKKYNIDNFENPSALYSQAVKVRKDIESSRNKIASLLKTQSNTIIFTGSGTESINLGILGFARKNISMGKHIISTKTEHSAVLKSLEFLSKEGFDITYLDVYNNGKINIDQLKQSIQRDTILISIMYVNNEIGTINDLPAIGKEILKWRKTNNSQYPYFHSDACQAGAYLDLNVEKLHVDLMSLNSSKVYGPKGVGMLYKRREVEIEPIMYGGEQEYGFRPGTENSAGIISFADALVIAQKDKEENIKKLYKLQDYFWNKIKSNINEVVLVGSKFGKDRIANNLNIIFKGVDADSLIIYLDKYGIVCSSGSACTTDSDEASHIILACGFNKNEAKNAIRFSMSKYTTKSDIDYVMKYLPKIVNKLRKTNV